MSAVKGKITVKNEGVPELVHVAGVVLHGEPVALLQRPELRREQVFRKDVGQREDDVVGEGQRGDQQHRRHSEIANRNHNPGDDATVVSLLSPEHLFGH